MGNICTLQQSWEVRSCGRTSKVAVSLQKVSLALGQGSQMVQFPSCHQLHSLWKFDNPSSNCSMSIWMI